MKNLSEYITESLTTAELIKHICKELKINKKEDENEVWKAVLKFKDKHPGKSFTYTVSSISSSDEDAINGQLLHFNIGNDSWIWLSSKKKFEEV